MYSELLFEHGPTPARTAPVFAPAATLPQIPAGLHAMKSLAPACFAFATLCSSAWAAANDHAVIAAMRLAERPDYSWQTTIEDDTGSYVIAGKTNSHGYTWVQMPMISAIARRLDRDGDGSLEAFFYGKHASVVRVGNDWHTLADLPATRQRVEPRKTALVRGSASGG